MTEKSTRNNQIKTKTNQKQIGLNLQLQAFRQTEENNNNNKTTTNTKRRYKTKTRRMERWAPGQQNTKLILAPIVFCRARSAGCLTPQLSKVTATTPFAFLCFKASLGCQEDWRGKCVLFGRKPNLKFEQISILIEISEDSKRNSKIHQ